MNLQLLNALADGEFHSGAQLSKVLGVSRTTVWNQIKELEPLGIEVHSVRGRGYRISGGLDLIDGEHLQHQLEGLGIAEHLDLVDLVAQCESTNLSAQRASLNGHKRALFISEYQSSGRGRRGRAWASPFASNLYFSLSWPFSGGVASLEGLSLAVGVALRRALQALHIDDVQLKWPNDLLLNGRKLGGVLIEVGGDLSGECTAVIGIGLNVSMPDSVEQQIDQPWADLRGRLPADLTRSDLLAVVLLHLIQMLDEYSSTGFSSMQAEWQAANAFRDKSVSLLIGQRRVDGLCLGVDATGALRLQTAEGEQCFQGGEISLRAN